MARSSATTHTHYLLFPFIFLIDCFFPHAFIIIHINLYAKENQFACYTAGIALQQLYSSVRANWLTFHRQEGIPDFTIILRLQYDASLAFTSLLAGECADYVTARNFTMAPHLSARNSKPSFVTVLRCKTGEFC